MFLSIRQSNHGGARQGFAIGQGAACVVQAHIGDGVVNGIGVDAGIAGVGQIIGETMIGIEKARRVGNRVEFKLAVISQEDAGAEAATPVLILVAMDAVELERRQIGRRRRGATAAGRAAAGRRYGPIGGGVEVGELEIVYDGIAVRGEAGDAFVVADGEGGGTFATWENRWRDGITNKIAATKNP